MSACSSIAYQAAPLLAAAAQPLLEDLRGRFLAGGNVLQLVVSRCLCCRPCH